MRDEVLSISAAIYSTAAVKGFRTATTLSALMLLGRQYYIVPAGDSRIYSIGVEGLMPLTIDNVSESGKLTSCIGLKSHPELYYSEGVAKSDVYLLCSDGLYKRVDDHLLLRNVSTQNRKSLRKSLKTLSGFAIERGERDNISIAIIKIAE